MKYLVKFFVVTFLVFICTYVLAEQKTVYIDMTFILNNSKAGKSAQDYLQKTYKENQTKFTNMENSLKKAESDLLGKRTVISKEEYQKKADDLRKEVIDYQSKKRLAFEKITTQRAEARNALLDKLDPILKAHVKENEISIVLDKKNIIMGSINLEITDLIVEQLNKELPSLNLK